MVIFSGESPEWLHYTRGVTAEELVTDHQVSAWNRSRDDVIKIVAEAIRKHEAHLAWRDEKLEKEGIKKTEEEDEDEDGDKDETSGIQ